ncbi:hypothetical protein F5B20DRAFT_551026 [Whalleya microplaca]|nr:hypothetical protein F5B20DRAFT_551026 [Whalleya microplaca]
MQHLAWFRQKQPNMVIVTPKTCAGWPARSSRGLTYGVSYANRTVWSMEYVRLANFCGTPSLSVPAGYVIPEEETGAGRVAWRRSLWCRLV